MINYLRWKLKKIDEQEYLERRSRALMNKQESIRVKRLLIKERLDYLIMLRNK